jgi:hypothetical protein
MVPNEAPFASSALTKSLARASPSVIGLCGPSQAHHKLILAEVHTAVDHACETRVPVPIRPPRLLLLLQVATLRLPWLPT